MSALRKTLKDFETKAQTEAVAMAGTRAKKEKEKPVIYANKEQLGLEAELNPYKSQLLLGKVRVVPGGDFEKQLNALRKTIPEVNHALIEEAENIAKLIQPIAVNGQLVPPDYKSVIAKVYEHSNMSIVQIWPMNINQNGAWDVAVTIKTGEPGSKSERTVNLFIRGQPGTSTTFTLETAPKEQTEGLEERARGRLKAVVGSVKNAPAKLWHWIAK